MNILDLQINETSQEFSDLWQSLDYYIKVAYQSFQNNELKQFLKMMIHFKKLKLKYNRFNKRLIYQLATYSLFGLHLRKTIAYLNISNEMFEIISYYRNFFNFLKQTKLSTAQIQFICDFWKILLTKTDQIRVLFFSHDKTKILKFLGPSQVDQKKFFKNLLKAFQHKCFIEQSNQTLANEKLLIFFEQFRALQRIMDHFVKILENQLLILDFPEYKRYRDDKIST